MRLLLNISLFTKKEKDQEIKKEDITRFTVTHSKREVQEEEYIYEIQPRHHSRKTADRVFPKLNNTSKPLISHPQYPKQILCSNGCPLHQQLPLLSSQSLEGLLSYCYYSYAHKRSHKSLEADT